MMFGCPIRFSGARPKLLELHTLSVVVLRPLNELKDLNLHFEGEHSLLQQHLWIVSSLQCQLG